jgi:hypothetical protein
MDGRALVCLIVVAAWISLAAYADEVVPGAPPAGTVVRLEVFPSRIELRGARAYRQLVVTGFAADGSVYDLTVGSQMASTDPSVAIIEGTIVRAKADGRCHLAILAAGLAAVVPVEVVGAAQPDPIAFERETLAVLTKQGCNSGACHGSPSGKGGFRLSLRGFDPQLDEWTLIREEGGRRTNPLEPEASLLLEKPMMRLPHGGGLKLTRKEPGYAVLRQWIAEGCRPDPSDAPRCVGIEVYPAGGQVLKWPAWQRQLAVLAHLADGSVRDVTELACFSSSDSQIAEVSPQGLVRGLARGEAAILVRYLEYVAAPVFTFVREVPGFAWPEVPQVNYIDELVDAKLRQLGFSPSGLARDEEFLRRVYLDVLGQLPTLEETRQFLADTRPDKRRVLIDHLLQRPEHARFWALKWGDLLRLTTQQLGSSGAFKYHRWLEQAFAQNMPYDVFARELLLARGSTLQNPPANFYRATSDAQDSVESVCQLFLGARVQCAKCHNHPFERWTQDNYYGLAAFFNRVQKKKSPRGDDLWVFVAPSGEVTQPRTGKIMKPWLPGRGTVAEGDVPDRRTLFVEWLTSPDNLWFAQVEANRLWSFVMGRGLVDPPDDFRESNPPSNPALLTALARDLIEHGFDRRHLLRQILNSRTYQADFRPHALNQDDTRYGSHYLPRMLSAEQLLDAICAVTGVPEPLEGLPAGTRATQLPAPDLVKHEFLKVFGQPERQTVCACERNTEANLSMAIQFFNGPLIYQKLRDPQNRFRRLLAAGQSPETILEELYLAAVCRTPTTQERDAALAHLASKNDPASAFEDITWAILNTNEFLFQH